MPKVLPKDDAMRKLLKHPTAGGFHESGPSEWPDDQFTTRRLKDGDITLVEEAKEQPKKSHASTKESDHAR